MAINFNAGMSNDFRGINERRQKVIDTLLPNTEMRTKSLNEDWVNSIYKSPGDMFVIKNGKLTGSDTFNEMPTKDAAWTDYVARSENKNVKPNRLFFEEHYNRAKANYDADLSQKLEGLKASGQFKDKHIQKAIEGLNLNPGYYSNPMIAPFMPKKKSYGLLDLAATSVMPGALAYSAIKGASGGGGSAGALKAIKNNPMLNLPMKAADWSVNKLYGGKMVNSLKGFTKDAAGNPKKWKISGKKETLKVAKDLYGKTKGKSGFATLRKVIETKGASHVGKAVLEKYGYREGAKILAKIFGKGILSTVATPGAVTGIGAVGNAALWAWTAKDIIQVANDVFGEQPIKEGAKF